MTDAEILQNFQCMSMRNQQFMTKPKLYLISQKIRATLLNCRFWRPALPVHGVVQHVLMCMFYHVVSHVVSPIILPVLVGTLLTALRQGSKRDPYLRIYRINGDVLMVFPENSHFKPETGLYIQDIHNDKQTRAKPGAALQTPL